MIQWVPRELRTADLCLYAEAAHPELRVYVPDEIAKGRNILMRISPSENSTPKNRPLASTNEASCSNALRRSSCRRSICMCRRWSCAAGRSAGHTKWALCRSFPKKSQQVDVVAPFRRFPDSVPVTDGDTDGRPIVGDIAGGTGEKIARVPFVPL